MRWVDPHPRLRLGASLQLSVDVAAMGRLRVELRLEDCDRDVDSTVTWRDGPTVPLRERPLRLRIAMRSARLFRLPVRGVRRRPDLIAAAAAAFAARRRSGFPIAHE